ncbi:MAG: RraA family protein [Candidatus Odinarchaeia archaeon]
MSIDVNEFIKRAEKLSTCNFSDALDKLNMRGAVVGILPMYDCPKIIGVAVTVKVTAAGLTKSTQHLGVNAIDIADSKNIIIIDNGGRRDVSCWGEILSYAAKKKGIKGVVIDGAFRDLDVIKSINFPVYARNVVPVTARGRIMQESVNTLIQCGGVQVRPGDFIVGDANGVVIIPKEKAEEILSIAESLYDKETAMITAINQGQSIVEVDKKFKYEDLLKK